MHEVLAPFVALSDPELPTSDISLCYSTFIKRFLPYAFNKDEEFLSLQARPRNLALMLQVAYLAWERVKQQVFVDTCPVSACGVRTVHVRCCAAVLLRCCFFGWLDA